MLARMLWRPAPAAASALDGRGAIALRPRIASHLVRIAREPGGATLEDMMLRMSHTWFWESAGAEERAGLEGTVRQVLAELAELRIVEWRRDGGRPDDGHVYVPTGLGNRLCLSPLPALGAARALKALKRHWGDVDGEAAAQFHASPSGGGEARGRGQTRFWITSFTPASRRRSPARQRRGQSRQRRRPPPRPAPY